MGGPTYYALKRQDQTRKAIQDLDNSLARGWYAISLSFALISASWGLSAYQHYQKNQAKTSMEQSQTVTNTTTNLETTVEAGK